MNTLKVLLVGDVVGITGRRIFQRHIGRIKNDYGIDAIIVNGENSASDGRGITSRIVHFFKHCGVNVITTGNHIWKNREIYSYWDKGANDLLRPANFPSGVPGIGVTTFTCANNTVVGVVNLQGRVFMHELVSCPFRAIDSILTFLRTKTSIIFIDFHAETTSEKAAMGYYVDGKVSGLVGTHTHIQTADERILPNGTGFISDLGMCGALNSMLGMKKEPIIQNFLTQMPTKFTVETEGPIILCGVIMTVDSNNGKTIAIERLRIVDSTLIVDTNEE